MNRLWLILLTLAVFGGDRHARGHDDGAVFVRRWPTTSHVLTPLPDDNAELFAGTPTVAHPVVSGHAEMPCADFCEPRRGLVAFYGYEAYRGIPDGGWENNGAHAGVNLGTTLGWFTEATGICGQIGGSIGVFNWSGTDYRASRQDEPQTQGMFTYGFYRRAEADSPWVAGVVQDWMFNNNFGVFGRNPLLSQLRAQLGYTIGDWDEIGVWGAVGVLDATRDVGGFGETTWRSIDHLSAYWRHKWEFGAETSIWFGVPERSRITGDATLGDYYVGARVDSPLNDRIAAYAHVTYMHPSAHIGPSAAQEDEWSFIVGLAFYPGRDSRSPTVAGYSWHALMPVANNGLFLVDTNNWY